MELREPSRGVLSHNMELDQGYISGLRENIRSGFAGKSIVQGQVDGKVGAELCEGEFERSLGTEFGGSNKSRLGSRGESGCGRL